MKPRLRIAILAHSTNPRGGVVHALELGDALCRIGHEATVHAPDVSGAGFFRSTRCATVSVAASPVGRDVTAMVETRVADYLRHFEVAGHRQFDVWHAQDGISGNALATLKERGVIRGFARTVHHVDSFADPRLRALQTRAIVSADRLFVVSRLWRDWLSNEFGRVPHLVGNGVDTERYSPVPDDNDAALRALVKLPVDARVFLAIGGIEKRKNTIAILEAFRIVHARHPSARLLIAGGASLLDHDAYQAEFARGAGRKRPAGRRGGMHRASSSGADAGALSRRGCAGVSLDQRRLRPRGAGGDGERRAGGDVAYRARSPNISMTATSPGAIPATPLRSRQR